MAVVSYICCYTAVLSLTFGWCENCPASSEGCLDIPVQGFDSANTRKGKCVLNGTVFMKRHRRLVRNCLVTESIVSEKGILETIFVCFMENVFSCFLYTFLIFVTAVVLWEHL